MTQHQKDVSEEGKQAIMTQKTLTGFSIGLEESSFGFSVGWDQREKVTVYDENTSISIQRPTNGDFFLFKIGSQISTSLPINQEKSLEH